MAKTDVERQFVIDLPNRADQSGERVRSTEFFLIKEFGRAHTLSGLVGAIWQVNDKLSFDVGFRHAITNGSNVNEIRAGLTVGFMAPFGRPNQPQKK